MRLFVAIPLPEDVRVGLAMLAGGVPGAGWVPADNLHLTLRFLGEVDGRQFEEVCLGLGRVGGDAFPLELSGVGHFGDRRQARVLWAGVRPSEALARLRGRVERNLEDCGLPREERRFHPHVTLARLRGAPVERVGRFFIEHSRYASRRFLVDGFTLFSSHPGHGQSIYRPEAEYPLELPQDAGVAGAAAGWA
ncbi:MAG: RNA 2',3'-cyclic phosphodiesterase [Alphaproteobacteria bacterium]|nr:RNA 2',3'-cyclic phosphodiesterase [Alphaproteobacteria bacterium]